MRPPCPAVHKRPFVAEFRCEGALSGTVMNNPGLTGTPAFAAEYCKVGELVQAAAGAAPRCAAPFKRGMRRCRCAPLRGLASILLASIRSPRLLQVYNNSKLLAIADEEGYVSIVDTSCPLPTEMADDWGPNKPRAQWLAHKNAVFDISWCNVSPGRGPNQHTDSPGMWPAASSANSPFSGQPRASPAASCRQLQAATPALAAAGNPGPSCCWPLKVCCSPPSSPAAG